MKTVENAIYFSKIFFLQKKTIFLVGQPASLSSRPRLAHKKYRPSGSAQKDMVFYGIYFKALSILKYRANG
jgi:hypothetical protein